MPNKTHPAKSKAIPSKEISPEADPSDMPPIPLLPEEELDLVPEDELLETPPPDEEPEPGEGP